MNGIDLTDPFIGLDATSLLYNLAREIQVNTEDQKVGKNSPKGVCAQYDVGASLGWAIVPERLWSYAADTPSLANEEFQIQGLSSY